jgi:hypothetical protein
LDPNADISGPLRNPEEVSRSLGSAILGGARQVVYYEDRIFPQLGQILVSNKVIFTLLQESAPEQVDVFKIFEYQQTSPNGRNAGDWKVTFTYFKDGSILATSQEQIDPEKVSSWYTRTNELYRPNYKIMKIVPVQD